MTNKQIIKTFRKPLIWVSVISILVIVLMALQISYLNNSIDSCHERQMEIQKDSQENFDYKCGEGLKRACIDEDKYAIEIGEDERYIICDTDRKEKAICIDEDKSWAQCEVGEWARCIGEDTSWTECSVGQTARCIDNDADWTICESGRDAKCIKKDRSGIITDTGWINTCPIGESAVCIDWNFKTICSR